MLLSVLCQPQKSEETHGGSAESEEAQIVAQEGTLYLTREGVSYPDPALKREKGCGEY